MRPFITSRMSTKLSHTETVKRESNGLRGNIAEELADANAFVSDASYELLKFHGSYQGYDRDTATPRKKQGLDKEWDFMLRMKLPAGRMTAAQYLALDALCDERANGSLRITTRQTFQFHQIVKHDLAPFIAAINRNLLSTLGGCGDVVRNVITCPAPIKDAPRTIMTETAYALAKHMAPKTSGYYDLWVDGEPLQDYPFLPDGIGKAEPLYGETYMPRKFKIAIGQPEDNCMDVLCNDLALLALFDGQELQGYNIAIGGGLGMNHNNPKTYPYLARPVAFVKPDNLIRAAEAVVKLQRDHGDRGDRKHARLKYLVTEKGLPWCKEQMEGYFGGALESPKPVAKWDIEDHVGWHEQGDGKWFLGVPIPSGRIFDQPAEGGFIPSFLHETTWKNDHAYYRSALREVVSAYQMPIVLTCDQNIIFCDIEAGEKENIARVLRKHGIRLHEDITPLARNMIACVAMPTCGKALAEAERVQQPLEHSIQALLDKYNLRNEKIAVRIAGCPNGCPRPYVGDIGIVGRTPDTYALYIGGDFEGTRLSTKITDKTPYADIAATLEPYVMRFAAERNSSEGFGDFWHRVGIQ